MLALKHLYLILAGTFVIGFLAGVYIYFVTKGPIEPKDTETSGGFEITGDAYGGCELSGSCSSYKISENGTYIYLVRSRDNEDERFEDRISDKRVDELVALLKRTDIALIKGSEFSGTCPTAVDDVAFKYEISYKGESYLIDTCREDTSDTPLFDILADYFEIFRLVHDGT